MAKRRTRRTKTEERRLEKELDPEAIARGLPWCEGAASPSGRRVLDVRPGSRTILSASTDPDAARNVLENAAQGELATGLPDDPSSTAVDWTFEETDLGQVRAGFSPSAMEDKWRIVAREQAGKLSVFFRRSWTNDLVFVLEVEGTRVTRFWHSSGIFRPARTARAILDAYLLGRECVIPAPRALGTDKLRLMSCGISLAGRRCDFVEPDASVLWFPSASDLGLEPGFESPSCVERQLPRELMDEGMEEGKRLGAASLAYAVLASLQPVREAGSPSQILSSSDGVCFNHDKLAALRRVLGDIAAMDERQLRQVAPTYSMPRRGLPDDDPATIAEVYGAVPRSRWILWGRGEVRARRLRDAVSREQSPELLARVQEHDETFAIAATGWVIDLTMTGRQLLDLVRGEGNVRGWLHVDLAGDVARAADSDADAAGGARPLAPAMVRPCLTAIERRRRGAMLGLAIGDALGAAVEFKARGTFAPVVGYRAGGPHGLAPGEWTDDTSMALALADSLAFAGADPADQARRYVAWWKEGKYSVNGRCFDIGNATREALARIVSGADPARAGDEADEKSGNGSIMRLAPIAIHFLELFPGNLRWLASHAEDSSATTHASGTCLSACRYLAVVLAALISGREREEVLSPDWPVLDELHGIKPLHPAVLAVARGSYRTKRAAEVRGNGYVVDSLEAALWAFHRAPTFADAVLAAVNLGEDADTTGAVCGQLAGAFFGVDGIRPEWLDGLARRDWIEDATARLGMPEAFPRPSAETCTPTYAVAGGKSSQRPWSALADARHGPPASRCYWVVPGRLLAGAYPGSADREAHVARLRGLWSAGVRTFVNLMEEGERSPQGKPLAPYVEDVRALPHDHRRIERFLRFAVRDLSIPSVETMREILDAIDLSLEGRRPVYVHCLGGVGRTGTVIGCWLRRHRLARREDVLSVLAGLRRADVERTNRMSPETDAQRDFVLSWGE